MDEGPFNDGRAKLLYLDVENGRPHVSTPAPCSGRGHLKHRPQHHIRRVSCSVCLTADLLFRMLSETSPLPRLYRILNITSVHSVRCPIDDRGNQSIPAPVVHTLGAAITQVNPRAFRPPCRAHCPMQETLLPLTLVMGEPFDHYFAERIPPSVCRIDHAPFTTSKRNCVILQGGLHDGRLPATSIQLPSIDKILPEFRYASHRVRFPSICTSAYILTMCLQPESVQFDMGDASNWSSTGHLQQPEPRRVLLQQPLERGGADGVSTHINRRSPLVNSSKSGPDSAAPGRRLRPEAAAYIPTSGSDLRSRPAGVVWIQETVINVRYDCARCQSFMHHAVHRESRVLHGCE